MQKYLWPDPRAVNEVNRLLHLRTTGREQDWETELADPSRIEDMLTLLEDGKLPLETRSALSLLLLASIEEADDNQTLELSQLERTREILARDDLLHQRMRSYWLDHLRVGHEQWARIVFG